MPWTLTILPTAVGCPIFMAVTAAVGLAVYYAAHRLIYACQTDDQVQEIKGATINLFRVVGWLFCLILSLTFTEVIREMVVIKTSIEREAAAMSDIFHNLQRFDRQGTRGIQSLLFDYGQAVVDHDWPALADDKLAEQPTTLLRRLEDAMLDLIVTNPKQEIVRSRMIADVDVLSDLRLLRLQQAQENIPFGVIVVVFGYLVTMSCFGVYRPHRALVGLVTLYTLFVGIVVYLVIAMSDPFHGATGVDPEPIQYLLETLSDEVR